MRARTLVLRIAILVFALAGPLATAVAAEAKERRPSGPGLSWAREIWPYTNLIVPALGLLAVLVLMFVLRVLLSSRSAALEATASSIEDRVTAG